MINNPVVFISDVLKSKKEFSIKDRDSEGNSEQAIADITGALNSLYHEVYFYHSPIEFAQNAHKHKDHVVLSTYYGPASAESKALVPGICETFGIKYIGGSSYTHMLCNDKYLSKLYLRDYGLKSAPAVLIRNPFCATETECLKTLKFPVVIKPNYGGGSNGIDSHNVVQSYSEAIEYCKKLFSFQKLPVIVEEYIPGYEVELILCGNKNGVVFNQEVGIQIDGHDYLQTEIYGLESKKTHSVSHAFVKSNYTSSENWKKICNLFCSFEKVDFMRVDCRINADGLYIIELSPDCFLGKSGGFYRGFSYQNISYLDMFKMLFKCGLEE